MGKATIISHLGFGQYRLQPVFDTAQLQSLITQLTDEIGLISTRLIELVGEINTASNAADYAGQVLNAAITNGDQAEIRTAAAEYRVAANDLGRLTQTQAMLKLRKLAADKRRAWLDSYSQPQPEIDLWCADLTEDLTGTVGTAEIGLQQTAQIIRPGASGAAVYDPARDGLHQPLAGSSPSASYYNTAMRPGCEKWRPCYRTGTISNLDTSTNTGDVALDAATSDQVININQSPGLTSVPIEYMTCNALAFAEGDHVLVEFRTRDWSQPTVVGFVSDPKPCIENLWLLSISSGRCVVIDSATLQNQTFTSVAAAAAFYQVDFQKINKQLGYTDDVLDTSGHNFNQGLGFVGVAAKYARRDVDTPYYITPESMASLMNTIPMGYGPFSVDLGYAIFSGNRPETGPTTFTLAYKQPVRTHYYEEYTWTTAGFTSNQVDTAFETPTFSGSWNGSGFSGVPFTQSDTYSYTCTLLDDTKVTYADSYTLDPSPIVWGEQWSVDSKNGSAAVVQQDKSVVAHYQGNRCTVVYSTTFDGSYTVQAVVAATITRDCPLTGVESNTFDYDYTAGETVDISAALVDLFIDGVEEFWIQIAA